jgi:hypothetical protein
MKKKNKNRDKWNRNVRADVKRALIEEAGGKCANPGCAERLLELHHIEQWHVYHTHNPDEMIALCPTCHRHAHRGEIRLTDDLIREWKKIQRIRSNRSHLYVEPSANSRLLLATFYFTDARSHATGISIFDMSMGNRLAFRVVDGDILLVNLRISGLEGREIARFVDGHIRFDEKAVRYETRKGRHRFTTPTKGGLIPAWIIEQYKSQSGPEKLFDGDETTILDTEVVRPGLVQVRGIWVEAERALVVGDDYLSIWQPENGGFFHLKGYGDNIGEQKNLDKLPIIQHDGPLDCSTLSMMLRIPGL